VRRYASEPLTLQNLSAVLAAAGRAPAQLSAALRIDVLSLAIEGLPPAAWRYDPVAHALRLTRRHDGDLRRRARAAALDQDVIGDASLVCVLAIERAALGAEPAGAARGYRHAFLEAGLAGERLYLEGVARGLGVCAVGAFYDDEAAALVGVDPRQEWVVHLAALGRPG
jgi:SagB-type dehydrogenase family enzyme